MKACLLATISSALTVLPFGPASPVVVVALPHFPSGVSPFPLKTKCRRFEFDDLHPSQKKILVTLGCFLC